MLAYCGMNHSVFLRVTIFSTSHTPYLTTDHHPISSHTAHRGKKKSFLSKIIKMKKVPQTTPSCTTSVSSCVYVCALSIYSTNTVVNFLTGFAKQERFFCCCCEKNFFFLILERNCRWAIPSSIFSLTLSNLQK